ncbi:RNA polymerase subunit sigma [Leptospira perolatii]|uniref:RNA polymerase subunit sigma n=1 Tax=Leptospira perolatii TaxID=2023191 RepID=A0A2M9ZRN0_9LEPT|nr:sigma-70 family RNA polymerase sigma factor [Leptospira perolatii]PJZ71189.1 RNA polymerase subunit sigma [Leptospira perolatii]PJZ74722.1 RNA polymerase subunit sigma [Leptospira perolatii]
MGEAVQDEFTEPIRHALQNRPGALEKLLRDVQDYIFNLSLRMLWDPTDAEDATQEILLKVANNLGGFRFESKFTTWVYSVASNHLLTARKPKASSRVISLSKFREEVIHSGNVKRFEEEIEDKLLEEEIRLGCVHAVLLRLTNSDRLVFVLSTVFGMGGEEGAQVLEISPENFRQKLSRAKKKLSSFLSENCGMWAGEKACPCLGIPKHILKENQENGKFFAELRKLKKQNPYLEEPSLATELKQIDKLAQIYRSQAYYSTPGKILSSLKNLKVIGS